MSIITFQLLLPNNYLQNKDVFVINENKGDILVITQNYMIFLQLLIIRGVILQLVIICKSIFMKYS